LTTVVKSVLKLEEGHNSYPLVCRRSAETVSLQRRQLFYWWGTPAYLSLVPRSRMFYLFEFCLKNMHTNGYELCPSSSRFIFIPI
jgi:hypothetical protein